MMGHSVSTLKLNILFDNGLEGDSGNSAAAGELGRGDAASKLSPGYEKIFNNRFASLKVHYLLLQIQLVCLGHQIHLSLFAPYF
jgi:hypothetical protein